MSEMLSKDIMTIAKTEAKTSVAFNLEFRTQDEEYKTMGWVGFNRLLVSLHNKGLFAQDKELRSISNLADQITNHPLTLLSTAQDLIGPQEQRNKIDIDTLRTLKILSYKSNDGYPDYPTEELDPRYETNTYKLDPYFFMALEIENNKDEKTTDFREYQNISRHDGALSFYTAYFYEKIKNSSCGSKGYTRDLIDAHLTMEQYIGHEDPNPKAGRYSYKLPGFTDGVITL